ncbi:hypothetical protein J3Q64DRAFT_1823626 [Phycomyces blakesleeanus]|uniref:FHA domain-containing protein n=1 Tax=Phycomyces blakesleeanus TaxID=4837 RepID=A0ABR3AUD4_PHYBL
MPIRRLRSFSTNSPAHSPTLLPRGLTNFIRSSRRGSSNNPSDSQLTRSASHPPTHIHDTEPQAHEQQSLTSHSGLPVTIKLVPNVNTAGPCFVFNVVERVLEPGFTYPIGRFSDRANISHGVSFKSKVVSRAHAQMWTENSKVFISDMNSSSGTYLNHVRIGTPGTRSNAHEVSNGDIVQLGMDFQEGVEPMYRAVKMRVEINPPSTAPISQYNLDAFEQLQQRLIVTNPVISTSDQGQPMTTEQEGFLSDTSCLTREATVIDPNASYQQSLDSVVPSATLQTQSLAQRIQAHQQTIPSQSDSDNIQECCICLYAIAPLQALFVSPCSHVYHYRCIRPIIVQNYPAFACPICRGYYDLESSVAVEVSDVLEALRKRDTQVNEQTPRVITSEENSTMPVIAEESLCTVEDPMDVNISPFDISKSVDQSPYSRLSN